jgi:DNA-binding PadR family transcriptional regulator
MTNSELILLSLIAERPRHGYEIEGVIEERGMRNWTEIAFSSIYFILNKLVKDGLADAVTAPASGRGPAKKVFTITPAGIAALRNGVEQSLHDPDLGDQAFLFGLSCLPLLSRGDALAALKARRQFLQQKHEELTHTLAINVLAYPDHVAAMFTYSLAVIRANLGWLESYIIDFENGGVSNGKDRPA